MAVNTQNNGAIYTPPEIAEFLTNWAIKECDDTILDLGTGLGVFVFQAYQRLLEIGCAAEDATKQIYGTEIDDSAWSEFNSLAQERGLAFPNINNGDFFASRLPDVAVVIGNPPYVRRSGIDAVDMIRENVFGEANSSEDVSRLSDLYVYFLLHAIQFLREGGRLAVITADPWLNVGYGKVLKKVLMEEFTVERLISIDRPVFSDAQVKPVLLLATKSPPRTNWSIEFVRVKNGLPLSRLTSSLSDETTHQDVQRVSIPRKTLTPEKTWSVHFKAPELYDIIASHRLIATIDKIARAQIGHQTLAKNFFVLSKDQVCEHGIEEQFLQPLAQSSQYLDHPVITKDQAIDFYLFYCSERKEDLAGTQALRYIEAGESATVDVRGKGETVVGYNNKQRIQKSGRALWYDLRTLLEKRGRAEILIPRLVYRNFAVYWNQAGFVPGELFIEFVPHEPMNPEVYLAILNSTVTEVMFRCHAQVYGGGTYNMNSGEVKKLPIINAALLSDEQRSILVSSYREFIKDPNHSRHPIDETVYSIMQLDAMTRRCVEETKQELITIATATKHR